MSDAPLLRVEHLRCRYGTIVAVRDLSFEVGEGEIVALLGPNGAGKSTALRAISGMRRPDSGRVTFCGSRVEGWRGHRIARLGMALVPEGRGLFPELSVEENLRMGGFAVDAAAVAGRVEGVCAIFPILGARLAQRAATLSGGEQQQLGIARALVSEPRLLIIDEMSLGLAPLVVADLYETVRRINRTGTAVLLVEQQVALALEVADRAYFLERGEVRMSGPAERFRGTASVASAYLGDTHDGRATGAVPTVVERVNVPMHPTTARSLQQLARRRESSVGEIVAEAIDHYLHANGVEPIPERD